MTAIPDATVGPLGFTAGEPPFDGVTTFDVEPGTSTNRLVGPGQVCGEAVCFHGSRFS